ACIGITVETKIRATTPLGCARSFDRQLKFPWAQKRSQPYSCVRPWSWDSAAPSLNFRTKL
ncbi:hypothetical protein, partial [Nostoc sp. FACHB-857]|uniref:hypothetical protein n=1 Tax=Nostoc sp. FACHB-857 TaxID=2692840 RepID=UPI001A7E5DCF